MIKLFNILLESGELPVLYHVTNKKFKEFDDSFGIGVHFGNDPIVVGDKFYGEGNYRIIPVKLNIKNSLKLKDAGSWSDIAPLIRVLKKTNIFNKFELKEFCENYLNEFGKYRQYEEQIFNIESVDETGIGDDTLRRKYNYENLYDKINKKYIKLLKDKIKQAGYDSIKYKNEGEGGIAYIAFDTTQIKRYAADIEPDEVYNYWSKI